MKEARKTANLIIRDTSKKSKEDNTPNLLHSKTVIGKVDKNQKSDKNKWHIPQSNRISIQQITKQENLTEEEHLRIVKQAQRTVSRKIQSTETKMENQMLFLLEEECKKTGEELQKEKLDNMRLKAEVLEMRKNIDFLNRKIQGMFRDQELISKNQDYSKMEKDQVKEQLLKTQVTLKRTEDKLQYQVEKKNKEIQELIKKNNDLELKNKKLQNDNKCLREEKDEMEEQLQEKKSQNEYIRKNFEEKKQQWDRMRIDFQQSNKVTMEKKGEKITKYHIQLQNITEKLKQQQNLRKKLIDKNKELEKQLLKKNQNYKENEEVILALKKRINDLSISKSTNNTIMADKISKLESENAILKAQISNPNSQNNLKSKQQKPYLFGPNSYQ